MTLPSIVYDRTELLAKLSQTRQMLAELRYIDNALEYLDEQQARWWQGHGFFDPQAIQLPVEFGQTSPFTKRYRIPDKFVQLFWTESRQEEVERHLLSLAQEAEAWAAAEIESISQRIKPFLWPRASIYDNDIITPIEQAHQRLEDEVSNDFGLLRHSLSSWEGDAADNFASHFYHPFEHTLRSQKNLLAALAGGIIAAKAIAESTQHSLMNVVHYACEGLREQLELRATHAERVRQESVRNIVIIAGGVASIVGAVASGGLLMAGMGAIAGTATIASTTIPSEIIDVFRLAGCSAEELLFSMSDALRAIDEHHVDLHDRLAEQVEIALERVEYLRHGDDGADGRLIPIRPDIIDGVDGKNFYLPTPDL